MKRYKFNRSRIHIHGVLYNCWSVLVLGVGDEQDRIIGRVWKNRTGIQSTDEGLWCWLGEDKSGALNSSIGGGANRIHATEKLMRYVLGDNETDEILYGDD